MWRHRVLIFSALALAGCVDLATPPAGAATLQEAVEDLNASLAKIPHLNEGDLLSDERGHRYESTKRFVRERQCSSGSANPLVFISFPTRLSLAGTIDETGGIRFSGVRGAEGSSRQNAFEIPLRVSTLTGFPREYLRETAAFLETKGLPNEVAQKLRSEISATYEKLTARIEVLVNAYDPRTCAFPAGQIPMILFVPPNF